MKVATALVFLLAFLCGVYLVYVGGWPIVAIGLTSILFAIIYTGGPFPLGYLGLGEIFVLIYYGPVAVAGTSYVTSGLFDWTPVIAGLAPGFLSTAILTVNNLRDIESDRKAGKKTLATRFGKGFAKVEYLSSILVAVLIPVLLYFSGRGPLGSMLACIIVLPAIPTIRKILKDSSPDVLNGALAETGRVLFLYSILFGIGWLI